MPAMPEPASPAAPSLLGRRTRVALVGSGFIADVHLQVLRTLPQVEVVALCDPVLARAQRLARRYGIARSHASVDELLAAGGLDAVHLLVPPALHGQLAAKCLQQGLHVLVEKPLVLHSGEVADLEALARSRGLVLAVNHNLTFHPALTALLAAVERRELGALEHVSLQHHVPLRQLQSGDVSHFMFQTEANILLEQGVHVFSMVYRLLGAARRVQALTGARIALPNGVQFVREWQLWLDCERGTAAVRLSFGATCQETTLQAIGSDGAAWLDLQRGSCWVRRKTRWLDFLDHGSNLAGGALHLLSRAIGSVAGYGLSLFGLRFPDDPFLRGMRGALGNFHGALRGAVLAPGIAPAAAFAVLQACEQAAAAAGVATSPPPAPAPLPVPGPARPGEVLVLGGTGLLGRRCVRLLRAAGRPVTLLVRRPQWLPAEWRGGAVRVFAGDAADAGDLGRAMVGVTTVLHLATVAGNDPAAVKEHMAAAVRVAGEACLAAGVARLVYTSSTAALYLGDDGEVQGNCGTDPQPAARGAYAQGKVAAEAELRILRQRGLEVTIVRPAIVVASDGLAEHSGVGMWVRDNHCVGWGRGRNALPLVLADDCAAALVAALHAPAAGNRDYNLAGDVRLSAEEYIAALRQQTGRDYHFHSTPLWWMWLQEVGKYLVKFAARRPREWPARRDLWSRSFRTVLRCDDARSDLGFAPETDRARFLQRALPVRQGP